MCRTRAVYLQRGFELVVFDVARPGHPVQYDTNTQVRLTALACSSPPEGLQRRIIVALERAAPKEPGLNGVSRETVQRLLKKATLNRGAD